MLEELKRAAKQRGLVDLLPLIPRLPQAKAAVDPALLVAPFPDLPRLVQQLRRAGLSPRLVAAALPRLGRLEAALLAHDTVVQSICRPDERLLPELTEEAGRVAPLFARRPSPFVSAPTEGTLNWAQTFVDTETSPSFSLGLEPLVAALSGGATFGKREAAVVGAAMIDLHYAGLSGIASCALRLVCEVAPSPVAYGALLEIGLDLGELKLIADADRTDKAWFAAYMGQRAADVTFRLGVETDAGKKARLSLYERLGRLTLDRDIPFLATERTEMAVAWVRAELSVGGAALARCREVMDAVCAQLPEWRYGAETRLLVEARLRPQELDTLLRDHVRAFGIRGALFADLLALRPSEGPPADNRAAIASKLYSELLGRPWDVSLWRALRHLQPKAQQTAWYGAVESAVSRQLRASWVTPN